MAFALTRSWMCNATGSTANDFASCLPAHSSHGLWCLNASARICTSSAESGPCCCAFCKQFGELVGRRRFRRIAGSAAGGGCRRIPAWAFRGLFTCEAMPAGGLLVRVAALMPVIFDFGFLLFGRAFRSCHIYLSFVQISGVRFVAYQYRVRLEPPTFSFHESLKVCAINPKTIANVRDSCSV